MKVTLTPEQFNTLLRLSQAAEIIQLRAQLELQRAAEKRNAYYATLVPLHGLPPTFSALDMNDETLEVDVIGKEST
jgi:hypothetical protein